MGNPFTEEGLELVAVHTKEVTDEAVVNSVSKIGEEQLKNFVKEQFIDRTKLITDPLMKNNLATFSTQTRQEDPFKTQTQRRRFDDVLSTTNRMELPALQPCIHEEADTRLMVHALDVSLSGHKHIKIRSYDTDVIVSAISVVNTILVDELWIAYGTGKHLHRLTVHTIVTLLGQDKSLSLK